MTDIEQEVDEKIAEMTALMVLVHKRLHDRFGNFDMKDILLCDSMKDVPSDCVFPMDFKYDARSVDRPQSN